MRKVLPIIDLSTFLIGFSFDSLLKNGKFCSIMKAQLFVIKRRVNTFMFWIMTAVLSAVFAGLTSILAKCGIKKTDSDLATALRTIVVLVFSWIMVFVAGSFGTITDIKPTSLLFLILSGLATGASWICYFKALSIGDINKVVPIDKSSTILTVLLAIICFGETSNLVIKLIATAILGIGIFLMVEKKKAEQQAQGRSWMIYAVLPPSLLHLPQYSPRWAYRGWNRISEQPSAPPSFS